VRGRLALAAGLVLASLAAAPVAGAAELHWRTSADVVASPDGRNVYAAGSPTLSFAIGEHGGLKLIGYSEPGYGSRPQMAISPNGRFVYIGMQEGTAAGAAGVHILSRDADSGLLTHERTLTLPGAPGMEDIAISPDGRRLYLTQASPNALVVYDRDPDSGELAERQVIYAVDDLPANTYGTIVVSHDGRFVYVGGESIAILRSNPDGSLTVVGGETPPNGYSSNLALSPGGDRLYAGGTDYEIWARDADTGLLTHLSHASLADPDCKDLCWAAAFISPAPDGDAVFSPLEIDAALVQAKPTAAGVTQVRKYVDGEDGNRGLHNPVGMAWSPDGELAYVAAADYVGKGGPGGSFYSSFSEHATLASYRRTGTGLDLVDVVGPDFDIPESLTPDGAHYGAVTINDGALYTNDPDVQVTVSRPWMIASVRLASDRADVDDARARRTPRWDTTFSWHLDTGGEARSVKHVYARFTPLSGKKALVVSDDIILDQTAPQVTTARIHGASLHLKARDNRSGVRKLQLANDRHHPRERRKFARHVDVGGDVERLYVRVFDGAGNHSHWRRVKHS
jgi:6-phosphogluconolactonase (cycloisomerase 2 family)